MSIQTLKANIINAEIMRDKDIDDLLELIEVNLSAANIIAMNGTPVELIPAPPTGKFISVHKITFEMTRTSTAFTGGGAISIKFGGGGATVHGGTVAASVVTTGGAGRSCVELNPDGSNSVLVSEATNLVITNATGAFAAGTGTARVRIWYKTVNAA